MAEITPAEAQRIITHMNRDHPLSLALYLRHFASLPSSLASQSPKIEAFTTPSMVISYGRKGERKTFEHKFEPPMRPGEARGRLEEIHREAKEGLGYSPVSLNDRLYLPPSVLLSTLFVTLVGLFLLLLPPSTAGHLLRWHAPVFNPLLRALGYGTSRENLGWAVKVWWLGVMYGAHAVEIPTALKNTTYRFGIEKWQYRVVYTVLTFLGGFPVWSALRKIGRSQERKLAKAAKH